MTIGSIFKSSDSEWRVGMNGSSARRPLLLTPGEPKARVRIQTECSESDTGLEGVTSFGVSSAEDNFSEADIAMRIAKSYMMDSSERNAIGHANNSKSRGGRRNSNSNSAGERGTKKPDGPRKDRKAYSTAGRPRVRGEYKCGKCGFMPKKSKHDCDIERASGRWELPHQAAENGSGAAAKRQKQA